MVRAMAICSPSALVSRLAPRICSGALLARLEERLRAALRDAADVEGPHRQLRAGLADRLRGDDADRLAGVHLGAAGEIAPVALGADAVLGLAGERRADLHLDDARRLDEVGVALVDQVVAPEDHLAGLRVEHVLRRDAAEDALGERGHDLAVRDRGARGDRAVGAAVVDLDDAVLRHVDEAAGEVARVRGLERGVGEALAGAVGRVEVLEHGQAFLEVRHDRRLDDLARGLGHQAAHAAELLHLRGRAAGAGVRHHVDRVRLELARRRRPYGRPRSRPSSRRRRRRSTWTRRRPPCCTSRPG